MSVMGDSYYKEGERYYKQGSYMKAIASFHKAGAEGHGLALTKIGYLYENGIGTPKDIEKAKEFYEKAGLTDSVEAKGMLGDFYLRVMFDSDKKDEGISLLKEAVQENDFASIVSAIRYIGKKVMPVTKEELGLYINYAEKMLRQGQLNEIDLIRLIYLENGEMTDDQLMQFGKIFFDLAHYEEAEEIFKGIAMRKNSERYMELANELKEKIGYVTAGKRAKFWLGAIEKN